MFKFLRGPLFFNEKIKNSSRCPLVGLTGTVMQNKHKELWYLVDLVQPGLLGDWKDFEKHTSIPIKHSR
jgi:SNF2 family DNA or RNA helicase